MRRMLIVDDQQEICDCLKEFFSARGFSVATAFSGEEALECLAQGGTDVVLLDVLLPGLSCLEILRRVKTLQPAVRVVMVSALDQADLRATARRYGAAAYITKPFDFSETTWSVVFINPA